MKAKKKIAKPAQPLTLYDVNVCGPDGLDISGIMENENTIADWWKKSKLYAEAMRGLGRVTMLCFDPDADRWYWASVDEISNV